MPTLPAGVHLHRSFFGAAAQEALAREIAEIVAQAPLYTSTMPKTGARFSQIAAQSPASSP